ncbi:MAG TPA: class I SAM-dependent methyltransferase [Pseudomonadales bacterium]|nr:class I SAM-dependent methyltransferase [Pseudomonadales bacterium]
MNSLETTDALLRRTAPLARHLADTLCRSPNGRDHCGALHGVWPELRMLGLAAEPSRHAAFYANALGARAEAGGARVLVSGCADWGMLETVVSAYRRRGAALDVTIVDRCPTPVLLCAWYGAEIGVPVRTAVGDVVEWGESESYDVVCTHSLLTYPASAARGRLVENWRRLLRPGGAVVTVSRLTNEEADTTVDDARVRAFGDVAVTRLDRVVGDYDAEQLRARVERFAKAQVSHPVGTANDVRALFEDRGFDVGQFDVRRLEGAMSAGQRVGGAARTGEYGEIVAVRR